MPWYHPGIRGDCPWTQACASPLLKSAMQAVLEGLPPDLPVPAEAGYPPVMDELMPRLLHMCFDDSWTQRTGGTAAIALLYNRWACAAMRDLLGASIEALMRKAEHLLFLW